MQWIFALLLYASLLYTRLLYTWVGTVFPLFTFLLRNNCWIWFYELCGAFLQQETVIVRVSHMVVALSCLHIPSVEYQSLAVYVKKSLGSFSLVGGFYPGFYFSVFHSIFKKSQVFFFCSNVLKIQFSYSITETDAVWFWEVWSLDMNDPVYHSVHWSLPGIKGQIDQLWWPTGK